MGIRMRAVVTASLALAGLFLALALPAPCQEKGPAPEPATAEVEAEGEVFSRPDQAVLFFHIDTQAAGAKEAAADNAKASEAFLKAMKPLLGPEESLKTLAYQVVPLYQQVEKGQGPRKVQTQEVRGYRVSHVFEIRVKDPGHLGRILDTGLEHGATRVRGPFYEHSRLEELSRQAAAQGLTKARALAEALALAAGLKVRRLRQVSSASPPRPYRPAPGDARMLAAAPETPVEVGEESIRARVRAVFELGP